MTSVEAHELDELDQARTLTNDAQLVDEPGPGLFHVPYLQRARCEVVAEALTRADTGGRAGEYAELVISPGVVALRSYQDPEPWESSNMPHQRANRRARRTPRGRIESWSEKSRRRMIRALAECDLGGCDWSMLTLTYPGDWLAVAPDAEAVKRHLEAFRDRYEKRFGPVHGAWKLEFQRRGAPHFHLLLQLPPLALPVVRAWVAHAWYEIVGSGDERHLRAGTAVDVSYRGWMGAAAVARYFSKHGVWSSKEYQHERPEAWETTGRWWGVWRVERVREVVQLDDDAMVAARRLLRKWYRSRHPGRMVVHGVERHGGTWVLRAGHRGGRLRSLQGREVVGAFVLCRDGPLLAAQLGRALGLVAR